MNEYTIRQWYDIFKSNNELVEIRILDPNSKKSYSGYFNDIEKILKAIKPYELCNIYFTLNVVNPACYSREQHDKISIKPKSTTSDNDIIARKWCLIDIDCEKPSDTNSTDEEKVLAQEVVNKVFKFLKEEGFEQPVVCDSANGYHLLYRQAMISSANNTETMKKFLQVLDMYFSTDKVKIDTTTFNASRICKLYGCVSRKGFSTEDRPQRESKILRVPKEVKATPNEYFEKVAGYLPKPEPRDRSNYYGTTSFDLDAFLKEHDIAVRNVVSTPEYTKYVLETCPFNSSHSAPDAAVFKMRDGSFGFRCLHNSCQQYTFKDFRKHYDPNAYEHEYTPPHRRFTPYSDRQKPKTQEKEEDKGNVWQCLDEIEDEDRSNIVTIPSGITQYDKECCGFDKPSLTIWSGNNGCVDCDTEFFNGYKWKRISEYQQGDKVLQYNADGTATLVEPLEYHKYPCDNLTLMTNATRSINQCLSDEHNVVYLTSKGNLYKKNFKQFKENGGGGTCQIIPYFKYRGNGIDWKDEEIRLELAISAEGHLFERRPNKKKRVRINLKHKYKKEELEKLLKLCNIEYVKKKYQPNDLELDTYVFYWDKSSKVFPKCWYEMDEHQMQIVKDNITIWDGRIQEGRGGSYSTTEKDNADFVQFCVTSLEYRCGIGVDDRPFRRCKKLYRLNFSKNKSKIRCYKKGFIFNDYKTKDGYKYCFSVPSGMLVLRRCGAINITGNSAKSTLLNQLGLNAVDKGFVVALYSGELRGKKLKRWIVRQAAGKHNNIKSQYNDYDYYVNNSTKQKIEAWLKGKLYNYNTKYSHDLDVVCKEVETIVKEKHVDMLIMDNLSALDLMESDGGVNEQQKAAVKKVLRLANDLEIAVHLVVHPKKSEGYLRKNDVSGTKTLTDLADNVLFCHRWNQDTQTAAKEFMSPAMFRELVESGTTNIVEVIKHREFGEAEGHIYKLYYESESKRLKNYVAENIRYGWEEFETQTYANFQDTEKDDEENVENAMFKKLEEEQAPF